MQYDNLFEKPVRLCEGSGDAVTSGCWMAAANLLLGRRNFTGNLEPGDVANTYDNPVVGMDGVLCDLDKPPEIPCEIGSFCISVNDWFRDDDARSAAIGPYILAPVLVDHDRVTRNHIVSALKRLKPLLMATNDDGESTWEHIAGNFSGPYGWMGAYPIYLKEEIDAAIESVVVKPKMSTYRRLRAEREARSKVFFNFLNNYVVEACNDDELTELVKIVAEEIFEKQAPKEDFKVRPCDVRYAKKVLAVT